MPARVQVGARHERPPAAHSRALVFYCQTGLAPVLGGMGMVRGAFCAGQGERQAQRGSCVQTLLKRVMLCEGVR